jgi:hypothetical protein
MSDADVRATAVEIWPQVREYLNRLPLHWQPQSGSDLALDDAAVSNTHWPSGLARTSLGIATEHFDVALTWMLNHGPTVFAMHSLLRTALAGGSQAVWLLAPVERNDRLVRASSLSKDAYWNHGQWASGFTSPRPGSVDPERLAEVQATLAERINGQRRAEVRLTRVIQEAVQFIYDSPPDAGVIEEALACWRAMSGIAHALPWEMETREESLHVTADGVRTTATRATWSQYQGMLGFAWDCIDTGWRLLDRRGAAAP